MTRRISQVPGDLPQARTAKAQAAPTGAEPADLVKIKPNPAGMRTKLQTNQHGRPRNPRRLRTSSGSIVRVACGRQVTARRASAERKDKGIMGSSDGRAFATTGARRFDVGGGSIGREVALTLAALAVTVLLFAATLAYMGAKAAWHPSLARWLQAAAMAVALATLVYGSLVYFVTRGGSGSATAPSGIARKRLGGVCGVRPHAAVGARAGALLPRGTTGGAAGVALDRVAGVPRAPCGSAGRRSAGPGRRRERRAARGRTGASGRGRSRARRAAGGRQRAARGAEARTDLTGGPPVHSRRRLRMVGELARGQGGERGDPRRYGRLLRRRRLPGPGAVPPGYCRRAAREPRGERRSSSCTSACSRRCSRSR